MPCVTIPFRNLFPNMCDLYIGKFDVYLSLLSDGCFTVDNNWKPMVVHYEMWRCEFIDMAPFVIPVISGITETCFSYKKRSEKSRYKSVKHQIMAMIQLRRYLLLKNPKFNTVPFSDILETGRFFMFLIDGNYELFKNLFYICRTEHMRMILSYPHKHLSDDNWIRYDEAVYPTMINTVSQISSEFGHTHYSPHTSTHVYLCTITPEINNEPIIMPMCIPYGDFDVEHRDNVRMTSFYSLIFYQTIYSFMNASFSTVSESNQDQKTDRIARLRHKLTRELSEQEALSHYYPSDFLLSRPEPKELDEIFRYEFVDPGYSIYLKENG